MMCMTLLKKWSRNITKALFIVDPSSLFLMIITEGEIYFYIVVVPVYTFLTTVHMLVWPSMGRLMVMFSCPYNYNYKIMIALKKTRVVQNEIKTRACFVILFWAALVFCNCKKFIIIFGRTCSGSFVPCFQNYLGLRSYWGLNELSNNKLLGP